ncbi:MAG: cysteine desulfurase family protein [Janthinobacterium lividum]
MKQRIYMDANATTPALPQVVDAMRPFWEERFGNASAVHSFGRAARSAIDTAREQLAALLHVRPSEIIFTSGGTESDNLALFGLLHAGDHLVVGSTEHDAVLHAADALKRLGIGVTRVPCDTNGIIHPEAVQQAMTGQTKLVSVMLANNETGTIQPVRAIADVAHAAGAWMHTDAVQACGKLPVDVTSLGCDLLSVSGHKMHATQGVGALWVRPGVPLQPTAHGGSHERRRRAGTENVPGIVGLGEAARLAAEWLLEGGSEQMCRLRNSLEARLKSSTTGVRIHSEAVARLPNTTSVSFRGINAEELVIALDLQGLAMSGGSACQSGAIEPSHVLRAMGLPDAAAGSSVRLSLSRLTTEEEVCSAVDIIAAAVRRMQLL